jgi:hypothetical protein
MHRRTRLLTVLLAAATLSAACGAGNGPTISDPKEIITKSVEALQAAKTVHLAATVDGTLTIDLLGTGTASPLELTGTSLNGDIDLAAGNAHLAASVPAFVGLSADVIVLGSDTYTLVSLLGTKYTKSTTTPGDPTDPATMITEIKAFLDRPEATPTKKDDASCGSKTCYQVEIELSAAELQTLAPDQPLGDASVVLDLLVEKDTLHPAGATVTVTSTTMGTLTLKLSLSDWDKAVTITAPPADQVE